RGADLRGARLALHVGRVRAVDDHLLDGAHDVRRRFRMAEMLEHQRAGPDGGERVGDLLAGDVRRRAVHRLEDRRVEPFRIDVARGGDADRAGGRGAEIRKDVAEQVRGDDYVEAVRVQHQLDAQAVDVVLVGLEARIVLLHLGEALVPVRHGDRDAVRLGARGDVLLARLRQLERVLHDAIDALAAEDRLLHHHLVGRAFLVPPADVAVFALRVFADHDVVDVARLAAGERAGHAFEEAHRAQVDVQVEPAAEIDQQAPGRDVIGDDRRIADRAEEHGLRLAQDVGRVLGTHAAVRLVPVAAPRIFLPAELDAVLRADRLEHAHAFGNDFATDAVAGDDCNGVLAHGKILTPLTLESGMRFAALETSTDWCSVALWVD